MMVTSAAAALVENEVCLICRLLRLKSELLSVSAICMHRIFGLGWTRGKWGGKGRQHHNWTKTERRAPISSDKKLAQLVLFAAFVGVIYFLYGNSTLQQLIFLLQKIIWWAPWCIAKSAVEHGILFARYLSTFQLSVVRIIIRSKYIRHFDQNLCPTSNGGLPLR